MPYITNIEKTFRSRQEAELYLKSRGYQLKTESRIWTWPLDAINDTKDLSAELTAGARRNEYQTNEVDVLARQLLQYHHFYVYVDPPVFAQTFETPLTTDPEQTVLDYRMLGYRYNATYRLLLEPPAAKPPSELTARFRTIQMLYKIDMTRSWGGIYDRHGVCL